MAPGCRGRGRARCRRPAVQDRPGLVTEILRFYDQLRRQSQMVKRFEELITDALGGGELDDRGAERLLRQTRFLAQAFRSYEQRAAASEALDEHRLRELLLVTSTAAPVGHIIVTVPDWIADPAGLFVADFDLLNRLPNLAAIDIVSTEGALASGFHERLNNWWPGIEEIASGDLLPPVPRTRPTLVVPEPEAGASPLWFTHRDREEELIAVAGGSRRARRSRSIAAAVVFKRPLPYLYLAADTLGAAGIPFVVSDALPLAAEPSIATVDLVLDALESGFSRDSVIALLRTPHLDAASAAGPRVDWRTRPGAQRRTLSRRCSPAVLHRRFVAGRTGEARTTGFRVRVAAMPALELAIVIVRELAELQRPGPRRSSWRGLEAFLSGTCRRSIRHTSSSNVSVAPAQRFSRSCSSWHRPTRHTTILPGASPTSRPSVRRWIGDETFAPASAASGVRLLDDQAARYGRYDDMTIVGLIESEWPERPRREHLLPAEPAEDAQLAVGKGSPRARRTRGFSICSRRLGPRRTVGVPARRRVDRHALDPARRSAPRADSPPCRGRRHSNCVFPTR